MCIYIYIYTYIYIYHYSDYVYIHIYMYLYAVYYCIYYSLIAAVYMESCPVGQRLEPHHLDKKVPMWDPLQEAEKRFREVAEAYEVRRRRMVLEE